MSPDSMMDLVQKFGLPLVMLALVLYAFKNYLDKFIAAADKDKAEFRQMVLDKDIKLAEQHDWTKTTLVELVKECADALAGIKLILPKRAEDRMANTGRTESLM